MRRLLATLAALALIGVAPAAARPAEVARVLPNARMVGEATYAVVTVRLFNAELWTESTRFSWDRPFALTLTYERGARGSLLINRSIREMSQRGAGDAEALAPLRAQLERCFPNVSRGDRITGFSPSPDVAQFYFNGAQRCGVRSPGFRRHFFGIWLAGRGGADAEFSARLRGET